MIAATDMTEVTPMTMPRIVNPERTFRDRRVSRATSRFSLTSARVMKLAADARRCTQIQKLLTYSLDLHPLSAKVDQQTHLQARRLEIVQTLSQVNVVESSIRLSSTTTRPSTKRSAAYSPTTMPR